jgi:molybdate transport system ATP-binding protein
MLNIDIIKQIDSANGIIDLDINLNIKKGQFISLMGKSGSGKTTFLRILAGLEKADGTITVDEKIWLNKKTILSVQNRNIGFVFQDYALFNNMTIEDNLLFVNNDKSLAKKLLDMTELSTLKNRVPHTLSGCQKQRVSLCRAMMNKPQLLLLDEPLSALDISMRNKLQNEILTFHQEFNTTTIMVSHDPSEMYKLSDRILVLEDGKIINDGNPKDILLITSGSQKFSFEG